MQQPHDFMRHLTCAGVACVLAVLFVGVTSSVSWPQAAGTIRVVVPFPAGGSVDILARVLAEEIGKEQGPAMVIENRPGAGTVTATELVARAAPDGRTLLMPANSFVINPHIRKLNYDPLNSFDPVCYLVRSPTVLVVNSTSPYHTLRDLFEAAHKRAGQLTIASVGPATNFHIAIELLKRTADVEMTFIPYPGNVPALQALMGDHVTSVFANYAEVVEQIKAGKLRALATGARRRLQELPEVPSFAELGYKDYEVENWFGVVIPSKSPKEMLTQLIDWYTKALRVPEVQTKLHAIGLFPVAMCGEEFAAYLRKQYDDYGHQIREMNIKLE